MKNLNVKAALVLSLMAFSACNKGGGGGSNNQVVGVPGVTANTYSNGQNQSCTINAASNSYTCTEYGRSTGAIAYTSLAGFCQTLTNEQMNQNIAYATRQSMYAQHNCQAQVNNNNNGICGVGLVYQNGMCVYPNGQYPTNPTFPTNPGTTNPNMKTVACRLAVKQGNAIGDTGLMQVQVEMNNSTGVNIYALTNYSFQKKFLGFINVYGNKTSHSEKFSKVKMYYTTAAGKADMIKLEAKDLDGSIDASVTGFAGSEVKLKIAPENEYSDATSLEISCQAQGASTGNTASYTGYKCMYDETIGSKNEKKEYTSAYNEDLMDQSYNITKSLKLHTEGNLGTGAGTASYEQITSSKYDASISTLANITTPTEFKVKRTGYSLKVNCQPVTK